MYLFHKLLLFMLLFTSCKFGGIEQRIAKEAVNDSFSDIKSGTLAQTCFVWPSTDYKHLSWTWNISYLNAHLPDIYKGENSSGISLSCEPRFSYPITNRLDFFSQLGLGGQIMSDLNQSEELRIGGRLGIIYHINDKFAFGGDVGAWHNLSNGGRHEAEGDYDHYPYGLHPSIGVFFKIKW